MEQDWLDGFITHASSGETPEPATNFPLFVPGGSLAETRVLIDIFGCSSSRD
jgi:hypothetical protein